MSIDNMVWGTWIVGMVVWLVYFLLKHDEDKTPAIIFPLWFPALFCIGLYKLIEHEK